jgi:UDP-N-acetylglucosamine acyltransferase
MVSSHIAHDCIVGNNVILANNVPLGGHAEIEDNVIIGGNSAVQQFTRVGKSAMIGGMCGVVRDIIPYGIAHGNRSVLQGFKSYWTQKKEYSK